MFGRKGKGKKGDDDEDDDDKPPYLRKKKSKFDEDPIDPDDEWDERNHFTFKMGWLYDKDGNKRQFVLYTVLLGFAWATYEALISPWMYYMSMNGVKMKDLPKFSQIADMKAYENQKKSIESYYKGLGYSRGTEPRIRRNVKKNIKKAVAPTYSKERMKKEQVKRAKMKREHHAWMRMARRNIRDRRQKKYPEKYYNIPGKGPFVPSGRRSAFVDLLTKHPYYVQMDPNDVDVEIWFPTGIYKQNRRRHQAPVLNFFQKMKKGVNRAVDTLRVNLELARRGELEFNWKTGNSRKPEKEVDGHVMFPDLYDKDGNLVSPETDYGTPEWAKDPEWDQYLKNIGRNVPHGSRPLGSKHPKIDRMHPESDPCIV